MSELPDVVRRWADARLAAAGLAVQGTVKALHMVLDGRELRTQLMFRDIPSPSDPLLPAAPGSGPAALSYAHLALVLATVDEFVAEMLRRHGPGRAWAVGDAGPLHLVTDDGLEWMYDRRLRPSCRLRALFFHENSTDRTFEHGYFAGGTVAP